MKRLLLAIPLLFLLAGCPKDETKSVEAKQTARVASQLAQAEQSVPPPRISNFTQLRNAVELMERADDNISTFAYYMDMHGKLHFLCESMGYGLPYSTQTTNPERHQYGKYLDQGMVTLPQPEPNGLYMPDNVAATWILCVRPDGKGFDAVYWEPDLVVSPFKLRADTSLKAVM